MIVHLNKTHAGYYNYEENKSPINNDFLRTEINLDILHGCSQMCPGCFIPRKNLTNSDHLTTLYNTLLESSYYPDEIVVGPTDIFDAENFDEIMEHPAMKDLYGISAIGFLTTLNQPIEVIKEKLEKIWSLYEGIDRTPDIDFKIVLDINQYINKDILMIDWYKKLALFEEGSVQLRVNWYEGIFDKISYNDLCQKVFDDFNAPIVITPSFLTDRNVRGKVDKHLKMFREDLLNQNIDSKWRNLYTFFDSRFNGYGCQNYSFYNGKIYVNPFLYDAIIQRTPEFESKIDEPTLYENLEYAKTTDDCNGCEFLMSCAERNIHMYMRSRKIKGCVALKEYMHHANN